MSNENKMDMSGQTLIVKAIETGADSGEVTGTAIGITTASSNIADASTAHALNATFSDTEVETALDALGTKINSIIAVLEAHGLAASS